MSWEWRERSSGAAMLMPVNPGQRPFFTMVTSLIEPDSAAVRTQSRAVECTFADQGHPQGSSRISDSPGETRVRDVCTYP
jgi:hypothetical protein